MSALRRDRRAWRRAAIRPLPGLAATAAGVALAALLHHYLSGVALLTAAVIVGVAVGNAAPIFGGIPNCWSPGVEMAAKRLLRLGIVLLGLRLAIGDFSSLGVIGIVAIVAIVVLTLAGTYWLGAVCGMPPARGLLLAVGYAVCGVSAVTAVSATTEADEEDVATAIAMVTICGSLSILVLPVLAVPLRLEPVEFGAWVGASVHDVGQVVAAASLGGPAALEQAAIVKLTRVALLAPLVATLALVARRRATPALGDGRPPLVPLFIVGFLVAAAARSTGWLPADVLVTADVMRELLLAAALFALGLGVRIDLLVKTGGRALLVGSMAWVLIGSVSLFAVLLGWLG